jgi:hypothetical protein
MFGPFLFCSPSRISLSLSVWGWAPSIFLFFLRGSSRCKPPQDTCGGPWRHSFRFSNCYPFRRSLHHFFFCSFAEPSSDFQGPCEALSRHPSSAVALFVSLWRRPLCFPPTGVVSYPPPKTPPFRPNDLWLTMGTRWAFFFFGLALALQHVIVPSPRVCSFATQSIVSIGFLPL